MISPNLSSSYFKPLDTCGSDCAIEGLDDRVSKVIAQDAVVVLLEKSKPDYQRITADEDGQIEFEYELNLSAPVARASISCAECHNLGQCAVDFSLE